MATATYRTGNPALDDALFQNNPAAPTAPATMTVQGTAAKALALLLLVAAAAGLTYWHTGHLLETAGAEVVSRSGRLNALSHLPGAVVAYVLIGSLAALGVGLYVSFNPSHAPVGACLYALCEGVALGAWSAVLESLYPGVVPQAVGLTFGTLGALLLAYLAGIIRSSDRFRAIVVAATGGVALVYLVDLVLAFFGLNVPLLHETGAGGIIVSLIVVVIAAANLVLDFDFIEQAVAYRSAKYMEWYGAFGLLVSLVWLYLEIVRLLAKLRSER